MHRPTDEPVLATRSRMQRWLLTGLGVLLVGIGALGVVVPGLPTTVFLLGASWCFARSCPWLEERLIRVPLFRPFLGALDGAARMPRRAVVTTLIVMWTAIAASATVLALAGDQRAVLAALVVALGLVGTYFVVRAGRPVPVDVSSTDLRPGGSSRPPA